MAVRSCVRPFERPPRHGAHQVEPEFGVRMNIFHRLDRVGGGRSADHETCGAQYAAPVRLFDGGVDGLAEAEIVGRDDQMVQ